MSWELFQNSVLCGLGGAGGAVILGFFAALWMQGCPERWRWIGWSVSLPALALPPFLVVSAWIRSFGHAGNWRDYFPIELYSLSGAAGLMALMYWPVSMVLVFSSWAKLEAEQLEWDPRLRGRDLLRHLLLPQARSSLLTSGFLVFVLALNQFSIPAILQIKVLPVEFWIRLSTTMDYIGALWVSLPLVVMPLLLFAVVLRRDPVWPRQSGNVPAALFRQRLGRAWVRGAAWVMATAVLLSVAFPLVQVLAAPETWRDLLPAFAASREAIGNSLVLSGGAVLMVFGIAAVTWPHRVAAVGWVFLMVPGMLVGLGLAWIANRVAPGLAGASFILVGVALAVRYFIIGWGGMRMAILSADRDLIDAARLMGAGRWQVFRLAIWPQIARPVYGALLVVFILCLWDVETLLMVVPPGGETVSIKVFNLLHYGHNSQVNALCLILILIAVFPVVLAKGVNWARGCWLRRSIPLFVCLGLTGCEPSEPTRISELQSRFFQTAEVLGDRGVGAGQFNKPRSLTFDLQDNLYVVDMTGRVQKLATDGTFLLSWQMPETDLGRPKGMGRDSEGNVLVIEPHYARINHFSPQGNLVRQWGSFGTNAGHLHLPRAIVENSRGQFVVSEYSRCDRIQFFDEQGERGLLAIGIPGAEPGNFNRPEGLGIDAEDRIYVADSCNHRIQVFSAEGEFLRAYGTPGSGLGELSYPYDIKVDAQGFQYVCEFGNSRIQIFDAQDQPVEIIGEAGRSPGQFFNPWSLAFDSQGNLYVTDSQNHRIQKLSRRKPVSFSDRS